MNRNDAFGGALVCLFGVLTVYLALRMPIGTFRAAGPGLFPLCLGLLLVVLSAAFTLTAVKRHRQAERRPEDASDASGSAKPVLGFMAVIAFAAGFLEHLGYAPTAFIVVMALLQILGARYWRRNLMISMAASAISHFLFVRWLQIPFPQGFIGL
jgi:putative tricarboxylic transport membrane protein